MNTKKIKLIISILCIISIVFTGFPASFYSHATEEVVKIDKLSVAYREGGKDVNGKYTWVTDGKQDANKHRFTFRINYATSGTRDYEPERVQIRIPKQILRDRDGDFADFYDISVPSFDDPDIDTYDGEFVFTEDDQTDELVLYNVIPIPGGSNGYIEVSYLTSKRTWSYRDVNYQTGEGASDDFYAYMHVSQGSQEDNTYVEAEKESNHLNVYIDTTAKITNIDKQVPQKLYRHWQDSWGTEVKPTNSDDYFYLVWPIRTWITANQPYNFNLQDIFTAKGDTIIGYSTSNGNFKQSYPIERLTTDYTDYSRYDYILTAHSKAIYTENEWEVKNSVKGIVDPFDQVDADTEANDNAVFRYKAPVWQEPTGHFMLSKKGYKYSGESNYKDVPVYHYDSYGWGGCASESIRKYNLDQFKEGEIDQITDLKYRVLQIGYAYPWTRNSTANDPSAFGHNPVKYVVTDNKLFLGKMSSEEEIELTAADANIYKLDFNINLYDANFDEEELKFSTGPKVSNYKNSEWIDFFVELNNSGEYTKVARYNPIDNSYTDVNSSYVSEASKTTIKFAVDNVTGWKIEHSNARYHTAINVYPYVTLHNTSKVMNYIGEDMKVYVRNVSDSKVYDYQDQEIVKFKDKQGYDYIMGIHRDGHIEKKVVDSYSNKIKRTYVIKWQTRTYESFHDEDAVFKATEQNGGVFYDLIPLGGEYVEDSVKIYGNTGGTLDEIYNTYKGGTRFEVEDFTVEVKENYRKTGRDLVVFKVNEPAENYVVEYQTTHSWNNVKDFGTEVINDIAYETGNDRIGDGQVDGSNPLFGQLDRDAGTAKRFLFSDAKYDISLITNAHLNLKKQVRAAQDDNYSYKTRTYPDSNYYYNIRFANSDETTAKDLVVMDSLENYVTAAGRSSAWRGTLKGINLKEVENLGIAPKVYYSTVENLDLEKYKNRTNYPGFDVVLNDEIDGEKVWKPEQDFTDLSNVKAFLVDLRKTTEGEDYTLPIDTGITMTVAMRSPSEVLANPQNEYKAFNNIYLWNTIMDKEGVAMVTDDLVHQDFTEIEYIVTADIPIRKVSAEDNSTVIKGTKWKLTGDSKYGNSMDQEGTTDENGNYTFKKIEAGEYTLRETYVNNDYFINPTEFKVIVGMDGTVSIGEGIEGEEGERVVIKPVDKNDNRFVFENDVRVHGDIDFTKVGLDKVEVKSEAYAVFDSADGSLTFFRDDEGKYENNQTIDNKIYYSNIENIDFNGNYDLFWGSKRKDIKKIIFEAPIKPKKLYYWFSYMENLTEIEGIEKLDTSKVENMTSMFRDCKKLTSLDVSHFDTSSAKEMHSMFYGCRNLTTLDVSHFDTSNAVRMSCMFYECTNLMTLDVSHFDTSNVESIDQMFAYCRNLRSLDVSHFNTSNVNYMNQMFYSCRNLTTLDVSRFDTSNVLRIYGMFAYCENLSSLDVSHFNFNSIERYGFQDLFMSCKKLSTDVNINAFFSDNNGAFHNAATESGAQIVLKYINPVTSDDIDTLIATADSSSNIINGGEGVFTAPDSPSPPNTSSVYNTSNPSPSRVSSADLNVVKQVPRPIGNTTFKLTGTSDYGTEYNEYLTSTSRGKVSFKDIEKGEYQLIETKPNDDYINPKITYKAVVDENGIVSIDGKDFIEKENGETYLQNEAWHNFSLRKTDAINGGYLEGAEFKLVGTDSYGNEVNMHETSNNNGRVTFDPLTSGTYILQEVKAPKNYSANSKKYTVEIDRLGTVKINGLTQDEQGFFIFPNPRGQDGKIKIIKKWNDGKTGSEAENRELPEITISTKEPEAKKGIRVTKRWEGDTSEDRPDNIIVRLVKKVGKAIEGEAYAEFDSSARTIRFFRDTPGKYANREVNGTKVYFSNIEADYEYFPDWVNYFEDDFDPYTEVIFEDTIRPVNTSFWFGDMYKLSSITGLDKLDTSNVTNMSNMFTNCGKLTSLDLNHFDTSKVENMHGMFGGCDKLTTILNVANMPSDYDYMCNNAGRDGGQVTLKYINPVTSADIDILVATKGSGNVVNGGAGEFAPPTPTITETIVETSKNWLDNRDGTWSYDFNHTQEDGEEYYIYEEEIAGYISDAIESAMKEVKNGVAEIVNTKQTEAYAVFDSADGSLTFFRDTEGKYTNKQTEGTKTYYTGVESTRVNSSVPWYSQRNNITNVIFEDAIKPAQTAYWFNMVNLTSITGLEKLDTSNVTNMYEMFWNCQNLATLDVSHFDTSKVTSMYEMFSSCQSLTSLDVSHFDTSKVTNMYSMFYGCHSLTTLDVSHFDTSNVTDMQIMFYNCQDLTSLDLSNFDTSKVTSMYEMFSSCQSLTSLDVSHFDTSNVTNMYGMFNSCHSLTSLDVSHFDTSKVTDMGYMFYNCTNLKTLNLSHFDTSKVTTMYGMFYGCQNLTTTLNVMKMPSNRSSMCRGAATTSGAQITLKYIDPVTSADIDTLVATKSSNSNVINGGEGTFTPPDTSNVWNENNPSPTKGGALVNNSQNTQNSIQNNGKMQAPKLSNTRGGDENYTSKPWSEDTQAYVVRDTSTKTLTFFRDEKGKYGNPQNEGTKTYFRVYEDDNRYQYWSAWDDGNYYDIIIKDTIKPKKMDYWFGQMRINSITGFENLDTSSLESIDYLYYCTYFAQNIKLIDFDTSSVVSARQMFSFPWEEGYITELDLSTFNTSNVHLSTKWNKSIFGSCGDNIKCIALGSNTLLDSQPNNSVTWVRYATLSGKMVHEDVEYSSLTEYDGTKPGWYKPKGTIAPNEVEFEDKYVTSNDNSKWVKVDDETWEYTFDVFDDEAQYYAWESIIPNGYTTDTDKNNYQRINDGNGNDKQVIITNASPEKAEEKSSLEIQKTVDGFEPESYVIEKEIEVKTDEEYEIDKKYSHTSNVSDLGEQNGNYSNNLNTNEVITIPEADKLKIDLYYNCESTSYDWLSVWAGNYPSYRAGSNRTYEGYVTTDMGALDNNNKFGGYQSGTYEVNGNNLTNMGKVTLTIPGDAVTFGFKSDGSGVGNGYGYYAVITGIGIKQKTEKQIIRETVPRDIKFAFDINIDGMTGTQIINDTVFKDGKATVYLRPNEKIKFNDLPKDVSYTVTERPDGDYPLFTKAGDTGTLEGGELSKATFVNKKIPEQEKLENTNGFKLTKKIEGGLALFTDKFDFAVSLTGLVPNRSYSYGDGLTFIADNDGNAEVSVQLGKDEVIEFTGLPIGSKYQVTELANEYTPSYTVKEASNRWNLVEKGQGSAQLGESLGTSNEIVDEGEDIIITFTNTKESLVPTNITKTIIPLLLFLVAVAGMIYYYRRRQFIKLQK